jgi:hypothetical protein
MEVRFALWFAVLKAGATHLLCLCCLLFLMRVAFRKRPTRFSVGFGRRYTVLDVVCHDKRRRLQVEEQ